MIVKRTIIIYQQFENISTLRSTNEWFRREKSEKKLYDVQKKKTSFKKAIEHMKAFIQSHRGIQWKPNRQQYISPFLVTMHNNYYLLRFSGSPSSRGYDNYLQRHYIIMSMRRCVCRAVKLFDWAKTYARLLKKKKPVRGYKRLIRPVRCEDVRAGLVVHCSGVANHFLQKQFRGWGGGWWTRTWSLSD